MLCHRHPAVTSLLAQEQFVSKQVGEDTLIALRNSILSHDIAPHQLPYLACTEDRGLAVLWLTVYRVIQVF
ncbi:hypothetical protein [Halomonas sp. SpR8]|uniref:hypothetical protein n=1 Tax=Halomonas sp. SpR8 TaxID=3050463 RepID=UPI0027E3C77A|nr:hypothetical protein [Halomonas sp. SpR8]MDQ7727939.1 hypothetical protein [Halomonas sp. SpR8]